MAKFINISFVVLLFLVASLLGVRSGCKLNFHCHSFSWDIMNLDRFPTVFRISRGVLIN